MPGILLPYHKFVMYEISWYTVPIKKNNNLNLKHHKLKTLVAITAVHQHPY